MADPYKPGDMIVLTKFKAEYGFLDSNNYPRLGIPYKVQRYNAQHLLYTQDGPVKIPVVILEYMQDCDYDCFGGWWVPCEIITHAKSVSDLTKIINDAIKSVKGA